jgi:hypothetical protein
VQGSKKKALKVSKRKLSQSRGSPQPAVDDFVAVRASKNRAIQQLSTSSPQRLQSKAVGIYRTQYSSTSAGIWFGTRGFGGSNPLSPTNLIENKYFAGCENWNESLARDQRVGFGATRTHLYKGVKELPRRLGSHFCARTYKRTYILPFWTFWAALYANWRNAK